MEPQAKEVQYTIRGVPREVDRILRKRASVQKKSLNQLILEELSRLTVGEAQRADFSDLAGKWAPDPEFDEVMSSMRQIDEEKWR